MKSLSVFLLVAVLYFPSQAQTDPARNSVYIEFLGNGIIYSLNYDRMFTESFGVRAGVGYIEPIAESIVSFPLMLHYLVGTGNSKFELGIGATIISQSENSGFSFISDDKEFTGSGVLGTLTIGYRYQRNEEGFVFRAGFTPLFGKIGFWPLAGLSVGYGF
jgi:hypothetical protein